MMNGMDTGIGIQPRTSDPTSALHGTTLGYCSNPAIAALSESGIVLARREEKGGDISTEVGMLGRLSRYTRRGVMILNVDVEGRSGRV